MCFFVSEIHVAHLFPTLMKGCVIMPIVLICIIIFIVWIRYQTSKNNKGTKKKSAEFWETETRSNFVRKKDISDLDYFKLSLDSLPFTKTDNEELTYVQNQIIKLAGKKILNLSGYSNTELKLAYGTANISVLSEYDQNYTLLIRHLNKWGALLFDAGKLKDAKTVLQLAVSSNSDIGSTYILLANIYAKEKEANKIKELIEIVNSWQGLTKETTLTSLNTIYETTYRAQE